MGFRQCVAVLQRWWWLVVLGTVVAGAAAYFVSGMLPRVYRAQTTILVNYSSAPSAITYTDALLNQQLVKTFSQIVSQPVVLDAARARLGLAYETRELQQMIKVQPVRETQLIEIAVEGTDPDQIRDIANMVAQVFIDQQAAYLAPSPNEVAGSALRMAQPAITPTEPIAPKKLLNTLLAALLGALVTGAAIALIEFLDDSLPNGERVLRATGLTTLSSVPALPELRIDRAPGNGHAREGPTGLALATSRTGTGYQASAQEAFRILRANLQFSSVDRELRTLLVTSAQASEGKSTTVSHLALVLAQAGQRVIVVDADLRRPEQHRWFGLPNQNGLSALLLHDEAPRFADFQRTMYPNLLVLSTGLLPPNPSELLASERMHRRLAELRARADIVLIDSPPVLLVSDPVVLARLVDGIILVADAQRTSGASLKKACTSLSQAGGRVLGVCLNRVPLSRDQYGGYYQYAARPAEDEAGVASVTEVLPS